MSNTLVSCLANYFPHVEQRGAQRHKGSDQTAIGSGAVCRQR